jgi:amidase
MSQALHYLDLTELADLIAKREISSVEATRAQLERIAGLDGQLKSYAAITADLALAQAEAADAEITVGGLRCPLHGVPIGIKDLCWTKDAPTAAGMVVHRDFRPPVDATVVERLRLEGAVILGKLQMTKGAYSDHHPSVDPPRNPWNADYWTGVSSSGPAVATAAGLCYAALGSDTGGSIRWPCGATGLTGLKPTWGRVSRFGVFELAGSMDHIGPIARCAADAGIIFNAIIGHDPRDPTSLRLPVTEAAALPTRSIAGLRIGVDPRWNGELVDSCVAAAAAEVAKVFASLGAEVVELTAPEVAQSVIDWATICAVEAAVAHAPTFPSRRNEYGPVLASVLDHGRVVPAIDFHAAQLRRQALRETFRALFNRVDLLLAPVQPFAPLSLDRIRTLGDQPELILQLQRYTAPFDLTGAPSLTFAGGFAPDGMPIGVQLIAPDREEERLLRTGVAFQSVTDWHRRHPLP